MKMRLLNSYFYGTILFQIETGWADAQVNEAGGYVLYEWTGVDINIVKLQLQWTLNAPVLPDGFFTIRWWVSLLFPEQAGNFSPPQDGSAIWQGYPFGTFPGPWQGYNTTSLLHPNQDTVLQGQPYYGYPP